VPFDLQAIRGDQSEKLAVPGDHTVPAFSLGFCYTEAARDMEGFCFQVSTLVGEHCKVCQQKIIKTTKNTVWGSQANGFTCIF
jgi:hypothetical protein